jgi:hypothetical protein
VKRLIFLLDGTWNDADLGDRDTNVTRIREILSRNLLGGLPSSSAADESRASLIQARRSEDNVEHLVFYERGVGTSAFDRLRGGALGAGLSQNIRRAYRLLCFYYEPGDEVFIFGFSRGAYTARSLVGLIGSAGLLRPECCTQELEKAAWEFYRTPPSDRLSGDWMSLTPHVHDRREFRISCVGVFDTVGALGIPLSPFQLYNRDKYAFHNVELSSIVKVNLHALATDEHRLPFQAAIWRKPKFKVYTSATEQVWFPGVHADIGGGYFSDEDRAGRAAVALDDLSLQWMIRRIKHYFPQMPLTELPEDPKPAYAAQHDSRTLAYKALRLALRSIANYPMNVGRHQICVSHDRHAEPTGEMVHIASLLRLGCDIDVSGTQQKYSPMNLISALPAIRGSYTAEKSVSGFGIPIVDWSGHLLDPNDRAASEVALGVLAEAERRVARSAR